MSSKKKPESRDQYTIQLSTGTAVLNLPAKLTYQDKRRIKGVIDLMESAPEAPVVIEPKTKADGG